MKQAILLWLGGSILLGGGAGCRPSPPPETPPPATADSTDADLPADLPTGLTTTGVLSSLRIRLPPPPPHGPVPVDSRALKNLFPKRIGTLKLRTVAQDTFVREQQPEAMARAQYESPLGGRIQIVVTDFGRPPPRLETRFGLTWLAVHIDRETDRSYERDGRVGPFRYYESFNRGGGFGQLSVLWNQRLLIEIESFRLPDGVQNQVLQSLNWSPGWAPGTRTGEPVKPPDAPPGSP